MIYNNISYLYKFFSSLLNINNYDFIFFIFSLLTNNNNNIYKIVIVVL